MALKACLGLLCGKECYNGWIMSIGSRRGELSRGSNYLSVYAWGTTGQAQRTVHLAIACTERTKKAGDAGFSWGRGDVCPRKGPREEITTWGRGGRESTGGTQKGNHHVSELGIKTNRGPRWHAHKHTHEDGKSLSKNRPSLAFRDFHRMNSNQGKPQKQN